MLKTLAESLLNRMGYLVVPMPRNYDPEKGFSLYPYIGSDGSFDYEAYRAIQEEGNKKKLDNVWASEDVIAFLAQHIKRLIGSPRFGLCHGTRRGLEQQWFREQLNCEVLETEISETAHQFPNTIQWDFHDVKDEWTDAVDFIYSNSFDHSYDPEKCLNAWVSCLRPGGLCIIEFSDRHGPDGTSELDPFGADVVQMPFLIAKWAGGRYWLREMLWTSPAHKPKRVLTFFVIERCADGRHATASDHCGAAESGTSSAADSSDRHTSKPSR